MADSIPAGTTIPIAAGEVIDSESTYAQPFVISTVASDVTDSKGALVVPANSYALLVIREMQHTGNLSRMVLGLNRVESAGRIFKSAEGVGDIGTVVLEENSSLGPSHRSVHVEQRAVLPFKTQISLTAHAQSPK